MSKLQTWPVVATTAERFYLARMLLSDAIKIRGRKQDTVLWRARLALGLIGLSELLIKGAVSTRLLNAPIAHRFQVTAENAEFLLDCREKVELGTGESAILRPLLDQLAEPEALPADGGHELAPFDEAAELALWAPPKSTDPPPDDE